jgi:hypothetical protein
MNAWPRMTTLAVRSVFNPRIGLSRAFSRPWSHSIRLFAYWPRVVPCVGQQLGDHVRQRGRAIGDDLVRLTVCEQRLREERPCRGDVTPLGDQDVDDLAVLVDCPVHVAPDAGDFDVGLVDEPSNPDRVPARSHCVDQQWREPLHPPEQGHVIDIDAALGEEIFEIAIRQTEPEIPADRQHDHLRREPEPRERRKLLDWRCGPTATPHRRTLADHRRSVNATVPSTPPTGERVCGGLLAGGVEGTGYGHSPLAVASFIALSTSASAVSTSVSALSTSAVMASTVTALKVGVALAGFVPVVAPFVVVEPAVTDVLVSASEAVVVVAFDATGVGLTVACLEPPQAVASTTNAANGTVARRVAVLVACMVRPSRSR